MADDSQLQLRYTFLPTPNPILASEDDQNPQTVDLQVMISNPGTSPVTMNSVAITATDVATLSRRRAIQSHASP